MKRLNRRPLASGTAITIALLATAPSCESTAPTQERTEPPPADGWCWMPSMVCGAHLGSALVDSTDPLWSYCHREVVERPTHYSSGAAEFDFTYHASGEIDRIDLRCNEGVEITMSAERDDADRVLRWVYTPDRVDEWVFPSIDLTYDADGQLVESRSLWYFTLTGELLSERSKSFQYDEDGKVTAVAAYEWSAVTVLDADFTMTYDDIGLVSAVAESDEMGCVSRTEYEREDAKVVGVFYERCGVIPERQEVDYVWSGEELTRSHIWRDFANYVREEDVRYLYEDGRVVEVQRDIDGHPRATYWLDYDDAGRVSHLLWWGHERPR